MATNQQVLDALKHLTDKLYGEDGFIGDVPEIKDHLEKINGHLDDHSRRLADAEGETKRVEQKVDERTISPTNKVTKKAMTGYGGIFITIVTLVFYLGQARGWW